MHRRRGMGDVGEGSRPLEVHEHEAEESDRRRHHGGRHSSHEVVGGFFSCSGHHVWGCNHVEVRDGHSNRRLVVLLRSRDEVVDCATCNGRVEVAYAESRSGSVMLSEELQRTTESCRNIRQKCIQQWHP